MNGIERITARIRADLEQELQDIQAATLTETQEVAEKYDKQAQDMYWKIVSAGKHAADQMAERMANTASMEARKQILSFKQGMVGQAFNLTAERLINLPEDEYARFLTGLAVKAAQSGREQLIFSPKDRGIFGKRVTIAANEQLQSRGMDAALTMSEETREMSGGLVVTDGRVDVNCSIESMIEALRGPLTGPVAETLFD